MDTLKPRADHFKHQLNKVRGQSDCAVFPSAFLQLTDVTTETTAGKMICDHEPIEVNKHSFNCFYFFPLDFWAGDLAEDQCRLM